MAHGGTCSNCVLYTKTCLLQTAQLDQSVDCFVLQDDPENEQRNISAGFEQGAVTANPVCRSVKLDTFRAPAMPW